MYKFDIHCHCAEGSFCAKAPARELVRAYKRAGFDGIVLTNHVIANMLNRFDDYRCFVDNQWQSYLTAKEEGDACGLTVLFGFEYRFDVYDFLVYGLGPDFMLANPDMFTISFSEFARRVPGAYFFCGCADEDHKELLHSDKFNFDEKALLKGVEVFEKLIGFGGVR
jgi:histidinol phosphatase-like PHP family hydrolase